MTTSLKPRPTLYRGVQMRSRLEAAWAEQFDALGWAWQYEPHAFASPLGQYLPDFHVLIRDELIYVEVKNHQWFWGDDQAPYEDRQKHHDVRQAEAWRWLRIIRASEPNAQLLVAVGSCSDDDYINFASVELDQSGIFLVPFIDPAGAGLVHWRCVPGGLEIPTPVASLHAEGFLYTSAESRRS